jgi:transcription elongation factor GreB
MSKAFLRESDFPEIPEPVRLAPLLPPGAKNLLTGEGAEKLREELRRILDDERPLLTAQSKDPETRGELQRLDERVRQLQLSLSSAEIVPPNAGPDGVVRFGSTVTVREADGAIETYRIVGVDETDFFPDAISWQSPLAKALLNSKKGEQVTFEAPAGRREMEVMRIE